MATPQPKPPVRRTTEQPPATGFNPYGWTSTRVKWAKLDYRWGPKTQWQTLDDSYLSMGKDGMIEPWNVEQVEISGRGITVNQFGGWYSRENNARNALGTPTKYCWKVIFQHANFTDVVISERERRKPGEKAEKLPYFVQIHFNCLALPTSHDATVHKTPEVSSEQAGLGDGNEAQTEAEMEEAEAGDEETEEGEVEEEPNPEEFPLAKLFKDRTDVKGLEIRLTFKRGGASPKNGYRFVWPAVIHFLSGRTEQWNVTSKKEDTEKIFRSINLDQWLLENKKDRPSATFKETPNPEGGFFWALRPKPNPSQRERVQAAQADSQQRRLAAPLLQYGQHTTSTAPGPVPQFGAPLPFRRPEASSSSSNKRELEDDIEARKQELHRQKVEQSIVTQEAYEKWQAERRKLEEVTKEFDAFVMNSGKSMGKRPRRE